MPAPVSPLTIDHVMERWMRDLQQAALAERITPAELEQEWRWVYQRVALLRRATPQRRQRALEIAQRYWPEYLAPLPDTVATPIQR